MDNTVKKKILAIINPISGTQSKQTIPSVIERNVDHTKFDVDICFTEYAGHATLLSRQAVEDKAYCVLAIGGDGTCNEIAKTLIHTDTILGIIPIGSGNGLARHLGIPLDIERSLRLINKEYFQCLDYCKANDEVFFCTCGVGFDALVSLRFSEGKHRGGLSYVRKVVTEYLKYKEETYELISDEGNFREKAFLVACANASQYGNNAYIAPHASMQDGKMDITIIKPFLAFDVAPLALQLFTKTIDKNSKIKTFEKKAISIIREKPGIMHIDGEPLEMPARIDISCIPSALKVMIPEPQKSRSLIEPIQSVLMECINSVKKELNI